MCCPRSRSRTPAREENKEFRDNSHDNTVSLSELLDEDFQCLMRMARAMCNTLRRPNDRMTCTSTLSELEKFNATDSLEVKQNVRKFLRFYLKVLRWTQTYQPCVYDKWYGNCSQNTNKFMLNETEMQVWLEEGRSYMAIKTFEDGSTIIYSAVAKDPSAGWDDEGFKTLATTANQQHECD
ncbi:CG17217 [Drosophila busckii]|uniref:CG17217 n=1 Tax=Drosophila busckii TaxID=30019 RepID=A0A0M4EMA0_DROBS|nr:CG17217 [Drosophila busckii]